MWSLSVSSCKASFIGSGSLLSPRDCVVFTVALCDFILIIDTLTLDLFSSLFSLSLSIKTQHSKIFRRILTNEILQA